MRREKANENEEKEQRVWLTFRFVLMSVMFRIFISSFRPHTCNVQNVYLFLLSPYL